MRTTDETFLDRSSERELTDWLLTGAIGGNFEPLHITPEPSVPSQIRHIVISCPAPIQQKFKRAVATAIAEWSAAHPLRSLRLLAGVAAYIRATAVTPTLAHFARTRIEPLLRSATTDEEREEAVETLGILLAVISGFAPSAEANAAAEALYYDDRLPHRFSAILLTALCRAYPERYPKYLPRMLRIMNRDRSHFHIPMILDRVVETITPALFAKHFHELEPDVKLLLTEFVNNEPRSRVTLEADRKSYMLVTRFGKDALGTECPIPEAANPRDLGAVYNPMIDSYGGVDDFQQLLEMVKIPARDQHT